MRGECITGKSQGKGEIFKAGKVTVDIRPERPLNQLVCKTFQLMTPLKCLNRRTIDLCSPSKRI